MNKIFLHGGPGFDDYLKNYLSPIEGVFYTQKKPVKEMSELRNELAQKIVGDTILIGHSFGGVLALDFYSHHPEQIKALVLISTPVSYHCETDFQAECTARGLIEPGIEDIFLSAQERDEHKETLTKIFDTLDQESADNLDPYMKKFDHRETLGNAKVPVMVVLGTADIRVPARIQRKYHATQKLEIPGAGHFPFLNSDHLDLLLQGLRIFLKNR